MEAKALKFITHLIVSFSFETLSMLTEWNTVRNNGFIIRGKMALPWSLKAFNFTVGIVIDVVLINIAQITGRSVDSCFTFTITIIPIVWTYCFFGTYRSLEHTVRWNTPVADLLEIDVFWREGSATYIMSVKIYFPNTILDEYIDFINIVKYIVWYYRFVLKMCSAQSQTIKILRNDITLLERFFVNLLLCFCDLIREQHNCYLDNTRKHCRQLPFPTHARKQLLITYIYTAKCFQGKRIVKKIIFQKKILLHRRSIPKMAYYLRNHGKWWSRCYLQFGFKMLKKILN